MDMKKLAPWNWFSEEEASESARLAQGGRPSLEFPSMARMQDRLDRLMEDMFHRSGDREPAITGPAESLLLKPSVDISATDDKYHISVEVPGIDEKDIELRLVGNTLVIRGEKKREQQDSDQASFYRLERSFGAFRRVLSLPEDTEHDAVDAAFSNGVLSITFPRKAEPADKGKVIDIRSAA
ncbi:Hsp20/alpha crystallin family protein [Microbulbifer yueqingensis]|uniref:HSP20 family protein n=1 Tax=Microbulbifer yueqingensis TaxID=658219 RepID=A0A1G9AKP4_9GAMM|nr:Hsp20/alpha crystallin family protein [Microbulbifer yueqingensis]SDK27160.1 HSP20 family protein [Microbulbifer yueqingensis]